MFKIPLSEVYSMHQDMDIKTYIIQNIFSSSDAWGLTDSKFYAELGSHSITNWSIPLKCLANSQLSTQLLSPVLELHHYPSAIWA